MNISDLQKNLEKINKLKTNNNYSNHSLSELSQLPHITGIVELEFNKIPFYMLNLSNDDSIPLKYLWRDGYEKYSLEIWKKITNFDSAFVDVGAHTGIYTIIANLEKKKNNIISIEPYFINFCRLLDNLKINNISDGLTMLAAVSNKNGNAKFEVKSTKSYRSQGGRISDSGQLVTQVISLDSIAVRKEIRGIKIDTEGHEYEVLLGAENIIKNHHPDFISEINEVSFKESINFLKRYNYKFYFINEEDKKLIEINSFENRFHNSEGINFLATTRFNEIYNIINN